jgi:hypothetical protein
LKKKAERLYNEFIWLRVGKIVPALLNMVMGLRGSQRVGKFITNCRTANFTKWIVLLLGRL